MKKYFITAMLSGLLVLGLIGDGIAEDTRKERVVSAFVMQATADYSGLWQGWGAEKLYDDLKIKLDFDPGVSAVEIKLQQHLIAGDLPEFLGLKGLDQAQQVMDAGMLLPLEEYREYLPNLFENEHYANAIRYTQDYLSNGTGHLYMMPVAVGPTSYNSFNWVPMLQWDLYKQIGMPQVETLEDYLNVAEAMAALRPVTDEGEKVYGFSLFSDWDNVSALEIASLSFFYGIDTEYVSQLMETNVVTGEISSLLADDSFYKRALKFYFEANQRGLLDPDSMSQTYNDVEQKFTEGRVLFGWFSWLGSGYTLLHQNNEEKTDGMAGVVADDMMLYNAPYQSTGRNWYFAVSKNCDDPIGALELLNWLYDPEVCQYLTNGPQGITWDYDANGQPYILNEDIVDRKAEKLMPEEIGGGAFQDGVSPFNTLGMQAATVMEDGYTLSYRYWPSWLDRNPTLLKQEINQRQQASALAEYLERNDMIANSTQAVNLITPPGSELEQIITRIGAVVKKYSWQMVYAEDEDRFEVLWDLMVQQAEDFGLDQVTEYYTAEWNKAQEMVKDYE